MLIPSIFVSLYVCGSSLSRRVNANSQRQSQGIYRSVKLIKKGEC